MDFDAEDSETGSAVSDEDLGLEAGDTLSQHDVCPCMFR